MNHDVNKKGTAGYWMVMMFVAISFVIVFMTSILLYFLEPPAVLGTFEKVEHEWNHRIVKVKTGSEVSTGFIMESRHDNGDKVYIATSYHGVDSDINNVNIEYRGVNYKAENLSWNEYIDLAIFSINCNAEYIMPHIANGSEATDVMALGYAEGFTYTAEVGIVNSMVYLDEGASLTPLLCYDVSAYVKSGMSGCPILTKNGHVLGMGVRTKVDNIQGEEIHFSSDNYVVPFQIMLAEYNRAVYHSSAKKTHYNLSKGNGLITIEFNNAVVVYDGNTLKIGEDKIVKVNGKDVCGIVDFIAKMSTYENRDSSGKHVNVNTDNGNVLVKVTNE